MLRKLLLRDRSHTGIRIENDGAARGGSLIERENEPVVASLGGCVHLILPWADTPRRTRHR